MRREPSNEKASPETAAYVATMAGELAAMASRSRLSLVAYLLDMAKLEAQRELSRDGAHPISDSDPLR